MQLTGEWKTGFLPRCVHTTIYTHQIDANKTLREKATWVECSLLTRGLFPSQVIPKTQKMVLDTSLLNIQHYKVLIKGKMEKSKERSSVLPYNSV